MATILALDPSGPSWFGRKGRHEQEEQIDGAADKLKGLSGDDE